MKWEQWELDYLVENYADCITEKIQKGLFIMNEARGYYPDRSIQNITQKANLLGLKKSEKIKKEISERIRQGSDRFNRAYELKRQRGLEYRNTAPQFVLNNLDKVSR